MNATVILFWCPATTKQILFEKFKTKIINESKQTTNLASYRSTYLLFSFLNSRTAPLLFYSLNSSEEHLFSSVLFSCLLFCSLLLSSLLLSSLLFSSLVFSSLVFSSLVFSSLNSTSSLLLSSLPFSSSGLF